MLTRTFYILFHFHCGPKNRLYQFRIKLIRLFNEPSTMVDSYTAPDKFFDDDKVARNILSAVAETRLEQTSSGSVMFPTTQDSLTGQSLSSVHNDGELNPEGWTTPSTLKKSSPDAMQHLSPMKGKHCADTDAVNTFKENSDANVLSQSSSPRRRQQRNMTDLEYCEDLVVATAVYDNMTVDSGEDGYMPTCIEYDPDSKPAEYRNAFYRRMLYAFCIVAVLMIGVIVFAFKRINGSKNEMEWMRQEVEMLLGSEIELHDVSYRKALDWMMYDDPHRFELSMTPRDDSGFHRRFILTQFYFATSVDAESLLFISIFFKWSFNISRKARISMVKRFSCLRMGRC
jgi:hypothetical protein